MFDYMKPTFRLAAVVGNGASASCNIKAEDRDLIFEIIGVHDGHFNADENCSDEFPLEGFCKFTATDDMNNAKVFGS